MHCLIKLTESTDPITQRYSAMALRFLASNPETRVGDKDEIEGEGESRRLCVSACEFESESNGEGESDGEW